MLVFMSCCISFVVFSSRLIKINVIDVHIKSNTPTQIIILSSRAGGNGSIGGYLLPPQLIFF